MQLVTRVGPGSAVRIQECDDDGTPVGGAEELDERSLPERVAARSDATRWVWSQTSLWYPLLLDAGVAVRRCHDLRLCHAIVRDSALVPEPLRDGPDGASVGSALWDEPAIRPDATEAPTLFDLTDADGAAARRARIEADAPAELRRQLAAVGASEDPARLRLLLALESAGALTAEELRHAGLPWRRERHERMLEQALGPRPAKGARPRELERLADRLRLELDAPGLNPDSPGGLLTALRRAGLNVASTRAGELAGVEHPAVATLLRYRSLARLWTANGWDWQDAWVRDGRFHAEYVPGGVVTGRWAGHGGGVLQLPKAVRQAVVADPGWRLVVADAAQLEPRVLAALSGDRSMTAAGAGRDLYDGIVAAGVVADRRHAKTAMLGAMYGATTGDSARLRPALARAFPRAIGAVDRAARIGERGGVVSTLLGRSSPPPGARWREAQQAAARVGADPGTVARARAAARDHGRFTRNFIVQGTAAEWALCWMAFLRARLAALGSDDAVGGTGAWPAGPHLVYFLHDEVMVHTPADLADQVAAAVVEAARQAGRQLFPGAGEEFPVSVDVVESYAEAK